MQSPTKIDIWIAALLAGVAGLIFYPFASIGVDPHHDGIMLKPALDVLSGQVLFRDTFSQYGPLTTYLQALVLGVQPTLLSMRILTVIAYAGSLFFLYLAWRSLLPRSLSLVAGGLFVIYAPFYDHLWRMVPWSSALALMFQSLAIWALMNIVAGRTHAAWAWTLGMACACTFWCRQPVGIILTGSVIVIAAALHGVGWRSKEGTSWRIWMRVGIGFGGVGVLILGHLAFNGALEAWWEQNIMWPARWSQAANQSILPTMARMFLRPDHALGLLGVLFVCLAPAGIRRFWPTIPRWFDLAWVGLLASIYVCFSPSWARTWLLISTGGWNTLILGVVGFQAVRVLAPFFWAPLSSKSSEDYQLAAFTGLALGSVAQIYPVPCPNHIYWALAPCFGLFFYLCWRWSRSEAWVCSITLLILLFPAGYCKYQWGEYTLQRPAITLQSPPVLSGMRVDLVRAQALQRVDAFIQPLLAANPVRPGLLYGDDALYLAWFKNLGNPSPYFVSWVGLLPREERLKRIEFILEQRPVLFLQNQQRREEVQKFLQAVNYKVVYEEVELVLCIALPGSP